MKIITLTLTLMLAIGTNCYGDILGAKAGYNFWKTTNNGDANTLFAQIEHPIPVLPNIGVQASQIHDHQRLELITYDIYGYYQFLDNALSSLDIGLGVRRLDKGKLYGQPFSETLPMLTAEIEVPVHSHVALYTKLDVGKNQDTSFYDGNAGLRVKLFTSVHLQMGYRVYHLNLKDDEHIKSDKRIDGALLGLHIDI